MILYDTKENQVTADNRFLNEERMETFPAWSPDGKWLYFCSAPAKKLPDERKEMHYSILRVAFDSQTGLLGEQVDTLYNARMEGGSASFPRISPDGRYLLFTLADYGTFPIWHNEAELVNEEDCNLKYIMTVDCKPIKTNRYRNLERTYMLYAKH